MHAREDESMVMVGSIGSLYGGFVQQLPLIIEENFVLHATPPIMT